jgi:hypothetical protein
VAAPEVGGAAAGSPRASPDLVADGAASPLTCDLAASDGGELVQSGRRRENVILVQENFFTLLNSLRARAL